MNVDGFFSRYFSSELQKTWWVLQVRPSSFAKLIIKEAHHLSALIPQHLILRNRRLKLFQVERFEVGCIFELTGGKCLLGKRDHVDGKRMDVLYKNGIRGSDDGLAFGSTVTEETDFAFFQIRRICISFHYIGCCLTDKFQRRVINCGVDSSTISAVVSRTSFKEES